MPAKSTRRKRAKNIPPSKKAKTGVVEQPKNAAETSTEAPAQPVAARPATRKAAVPVRARIEEVVNAAEVYAHVKPELTTIGILAVVMLAILGILGAVL